MKKVYLIDYTKINNYNLDNPISHKITAYSTMKNAWKALLYLSVEEPTQQELYISSLNVNTENLDCELRLPTRENKLLIIKFGKITITAQIIEAEIIVKVEEK